MVWGEDPPRPAGRAWAGGTGSARVARAEAGSGAWTRVLRAVRDALRRLPDGRPHDPLRRQALSRPDQPLRHRPVGRHW